MSCANYKELIKHMGHKIVIVAYGKNDTVIDFEKPLTYYDQYDNVSIECETCNEVILSFDKKE